MKPRESGGDKFCLADTGLRDDDITAASQGTERQSALVLYPFEAFLLEQRGNLYDAPRKLTNPRETICGGARPIYVVG